VAEDIENYVMHLIERYNAGRRTKRYGVVTSWDPKTHLSKVMVQPEGQESGWLPTHTMAAGDGYGHMTGLSPGDQVEITHQEGEFEAGAITSRVHSLVDKPPPLESGEQLFMAKFKQFIKMEKDGSITLTDKSGKASIKMDRSGNITLSASQYTLNVTEKHAINGAPVDINS
jgi:phage baseplate assembly protein gpV